MIFLDFVIGGRSDEEQNPWTICDGNWGGGGPPSWFTFENFPKGWVFWKGVQNIFPDEGWPTKQIWTRVWKPDEATNLNKGRWYPISSEEISNLPPLEDMSVVRGQASMDYAFSSFIFPVILKCAPESICDQLISVQPMAAP